MNILVTGGAGYIGSHAAQHLVNAGHKVVVVDNLGRGHAAAIERLQASLGDEAKRLVFVEGDTADRHQMTSIIAGHGIEAVMHFAALAYVGESVTDPLRYHQNNTSAAISLLQACDDVGVQRFVFSSTCATYGEPEAVPIVETEKQSPINPYGWSKLHVERVLKDYAEGRRLAGKPFAYAALRYFNVAGADRTGVLGEWHKPESHLIPLVIFAAMGKRDEITVFGTDYDTPDGTCIRDYVHVEDLVAAHALVLEKLEPGAHDERYYNVGIGKGYSVREVIDSARDVTGRDIRVVEGDRRAGDPPMLFADPTRIQTELGWSAQITDLREIIGSAWRWYDANPNGYDD
ncbi:MAG: UDP-glucose 4-epimerase GalE [Planctomycetota bacterium]